ncbi:MAG: L,D-transpeptidase family protein [Campylobacterales bacterium]|nr:L,D-transpeptidase family protein [Campylobacterales bacterium]
MSTKSLFTLLCAASLWGTSDQIVLVIADDMNATTAMMSTYERSNARYRLVTPPFEVNLGRSGLGWDEGAEPLKREGDGRAPAGIYPLSAAFGYAPSEQTALPYMYADERLICVDDAAHPDYNRIITMPQENPPKSFEWMRRDDEQYRMGIVVEYNAKRTPERGSCVFLHVQKAPLKPSSGCTTMEAKQMQALLRWLDSAKSPLLVQIPASACDAMRLRFEGILCPK